MPNFTREEIDKVVVKLVHCPNCPDQGWYAVEDENGEPEQEQCRFCYVVENSYFNAAQTEAAKNSLVEVQANVDELSKQLADFHAKLTDNAQASPKE